MHHFRLEMQKNQRSCLQIVHVNNATAFSSTSVRVEDKHEFAKTVEASKGNLNEKLDVYTKQ